MGMGDIQAIFAMQCLKFTSESDYLPLTEPFPELL